MRLLFLGLAFPLPANNGHRLRTWHLLRGLAAEGHKVTLMAFGSSAEASGANRALLDTVCHDFEVVPLDWAQLSSTSDLLGRLRHLVAPRPYAVSRFVSAEMRSRIIARLEREPFDAALCDVFSIVNLPHAPVPVILNHENVEHIILQRYLRKERNPARRAYAWIEYQKMRAWEAGVCARASVGLACSEVDRSIVRDLCPGLPTVVVPNVVDPGPVATGTEEDPPTILFQGGMDWFPNRDAVRFFVAAILPEIRRHIPQVRFLVAGRNPDPDFIRFFQHVPGMAFTGTVPDMRSVIDRASVCVAPLRIGSGTRLKILEAAAASKPTIATRIGAEGLAFEDGHDILLADEPVDFAAATVSVLRDRGRRQAIGRAARERVERSYTQAALQTALHQGLGVLVGAR